MLLKSLKLSGMDTGMMKSKKGPIRFDSSLIRVIFVSIFHIVFRTPIHNR